MHKTYKTYKTYKMMIGASCNTPWVCFSAVWFGSGAQSYHWVMQRAELPRGNAAHTAPPFTVHIRTHPYLSVPTAPPAAALQTAAAIQNLSAQNYRRGMLRAKLPQGNAWQLDSNGGMQSAHGVTLQSDLSDLSDKDGGARLRPGGLRRGKSCDTPWVCFAAVCFGSSDKLPPGYAARRVTAG